MRVLLNTKTMLFSTTSHDMENMGRSVLWMYLYLVSFADQLVQTPRATHSISGCLHVAQLSWTSTLHRCAAFQAPTKHCLVTAALHQLNSHPVALAASIFSSRGKHKWFSRDICLSGVKNVKIVNCKSRKQNTYHVTVLVSEQLLESWLDHFPFVKLAKR